MLHPIYHGRNLHPEHIETAQEYVLEENPELVPELCHLQTDDITLLKALGHDATCGKTKSIVWWKCIVSFESVSHELSSFTLRLLSLPASAASMERIFSNFGLIQTKLRNRLGLGKASNLVMCYKCLRGKENIDR
ncbi:hypothetical protein LSH36_489g01044 [Paralvinella palmiformis]|uniref:HAT C-terminal dimerisation domain-containing protein n=1 Tax=Paralvinella palmiformis TaxID=53620 RepID=A0AAD9JAC2_9ANNE|nr:hypothetical protein LSH36_489g01044 [Paralvinella palmiformis]